ncbi:MAG: hypothetical protein WCK13_11450 [Ignavibacteriota bacterium]
MKTTNKQTKHFNTALTITFCLIVISIFAFTNSYAQVGIGVDTPTAILHLQAGTATANTAPLKFTAGPLLTTPEPGAIEYKGHTFYATSYLVRRSIVLAQDVDLAPVTVANTTAETVVHTEEMMANYLTAGKVIIARLNGSFLTSGNGQIFTVRLRVAGTLVCTVTSTGQSTGLTPRAFEIDLTSTVRSIGSSGTIVTFGKVTQDNVAPNSGIGTASINTTGSNTMTISVQWTEASASNSLTIEQGYTECVDSNN